MRVFSSYEDALALYIMIQSDGSGLKKESSNPDAMDMTELQSMMRDLNQILAR